MKKSQRKEDIYNTYNHQLASKKYKEFLQTRKKKKTDQWKDEQKTWTGIPQKKNPMANKVFEKCLISLGIKKSAY